MPTRIRQLERADLDDQQTRIHDAILETRGDINGPFRVWLNSPEFADRAQQLGDLVRYHTKLDRRLTELVILVTARSWDCQLEWTLHEPLALEAGVDTAVVEIIRLGQLPEFEMQDERIVYDYTVDFDTTRITASLVTVEILTDGQRTRLLYTEQAVYLDGGDTPADRERGTIVELDKLDVALSS